MWGRKHKAVHLSTGVNYFSLMCEKLLCCFTKPNHYSSQSLISACSAASNFYSESLSEHEMTPVLHTVVLTRVKKCENVEFTCEEASLHVS